MGGGACKENESTIDQVSLTYTVAIRCEKAVYFVHGSKVRPPLGMKITLRIQILSLQPVG